MPSLSIRASGAPRRRSYTALVDVFRPIEGSRLLKDVFRPAFVEDL
ncbi:MAG TPA: hypothetical protein VFP68_13440 [Burkholderiaceae bacterium]|nr:hypothetical protein [Burkholderiaceae bacterium]